MSRRTNLKKPVASDATAVSRGLSRLPSLALAAGLAFLVLVVFGQILGHAMVEWDDIEAIDRNPDYNPPAIEKLGHYWTDWRTGYRQFYAPVLYTTWGLTAIATNAYEPQPGEFWQIHAGPFHALSLLAHLGAALLVFALLRRLLLRPESQANLLRAQGASRADDDRRGNFSRVTIPAFIGAAAFAVHPIQVEAVAWASTLYTPMSVMLALASIVLFLRFADATLAPAKGRQAWRSWLTFAAATICFALALLTKPSIVLTPILAAIFVLFLHPHSRRRSVVLASLLPWLVMAGLITYITTQLTQTASYTFRPSIAARLLIAGDTVTFYLGKLVFPFGFAPDYGRTPQAALASGAVWMTATIAGVVTIACLALVRRIPWLTIAWLTFLAGMAANLGLVPFDYQLYSTVADRYAFAAMPGVAIAIAFFVRWMATRGAATARERRSSSAQSAPRRSTRVIRTLTVAALILVFLAILSARQAGRWKDGQTLFAHSLAVNPDSAAAHWAMMTIHDLQNRPADALPHARRIVELHGHDPRVWQYAGRVFGRNGDWPAAIDAHRKAIVLQNDGRHEVTPDPYIALGAALDQGGQPADAEQAFVDAVRRFPNHAGAHQNLGTFYSRSRRFDEALIQYQEALRLEPASPMYQAAVRDLTARRGR